MNEDDELLAKLGDAIGPVETDPPAERISAVRAAAEAARARSALCRSPTAAPTVPLILARCRARDVSS